jgi:MULE transposase domain
VENEPAAKRYETMATEALPDLAALNDQLVRNITRQHDKEVWALHSNEVTSIAMRVSFYIWAAESNFHVRISCIHLNLSFLAQWAMDGKEMESVFAGEPVLTGTVIIVLCNQIMRGWARKYMHKSVLMMDSTFGLNLHGYSLFAVMTVGEHEEGLPLCFFITGDEKEETITTALMQFKLYLAADGGPQVSPSTSMTDDCQAEQNAIRCPATF